MLNNPISYTEAGIKCAKARKVGDESTARHWKEHFTAMHALETPDGKALARRLFDKAYKLAR